MESLASEESNRPMPPEGAEQSRPEDWLDEGDLSQIREMLELLPEERLRRIQGSLNSAIQLRNGLLRKNQPTVDFVGTLEVLVRHRVEFIIIDGIAAAFVGTPVMSSDLDILCHAAVANQERLLKGLRELNAYVDDGADDHVSPSLEALTRAGRLSLVTSHGPLNLHWSVGGFRYPDLADKTDRHRVADFSVHALSLESQITVRETAQRLLDGYFLLFLWSISRLDKPGAAQTRPVTES